MAATSSFDPPSVLHEFKGEIIQIDASKKSSDEETKLKSFLESCKTLGIVGLDLEWPMDNPGEDNEIALIQISTFTQCLLLRTHIKPAILPEGVRELLIDPNVIKSVATFDLADEGKLKNTFSLEINVEKHAYLDVAILADLLTLPSRGLKKIIAHCGWHVKKAFAICKSAWATEKLSDAQIQYAADDAYFTLLVAKPMLQQLVDSKECCKSVEKRALSCYRTMLKKCGENDVSSIGTIDNSEFREAFLALRTACKEVFDAENEMQGWVDATSLLKYKPVRAAAKCTDVTLSMSFFMRNRDLFEAKVTSKEDGNRLLVRTREVEDSSEIPLDTEEESSFVSTIKERLIRMEPKAWVARSKLTTLPDSTVEDLIERHAAGFIEMSDTPETGLLLHLPKHPRASSPEAAKGVMVKNLENLAGVDKQTAKELIARDSKTSDVHKIYLIY